MKILHYSDKTAPNFLEMYQECDLLITTGDLTFFDFVGLEEIQDKKVAFGVYGNHDSEGYLDKYGIINLHNQVYEWNGLRFGGFQGCPRYKRGGGPQFIEEEAVEWANSFPSVDILLLHAGPKDMLDDSSDNTHTGSVAIKQYVIEKKPKYVFCGHQYSNEDMNFETTSLFRTYGARFIELEM